MAAAAIVDVVGLISGVLGIVGFVQSNLPAAPDADHSALRIAVGLSETAQGNSPYVAVFNELKEFVGYWDWLDYPFGTSQKFIDRGSFVDISVTQSCSSCQKGQQATYLQLYQQSAGTDAICIAYLSQTWADGGHRGWLGDIGRLCGAKWYHSDIIVGDESKNFMPSCTWLDYDHTNDINTAAMQIHMSDFTYSPDATVPTNTQEYYCSPERMIFKYDATRNDAVTPSLWPFTVGGTKRMLASRDATRKDKKLLRQRSPFSSRLIASNYEQHSAAELCADDASYGPDFVSIYESTFCDMTSKTVWPLCSNSVTSDCFDYGSYSLVSRRGIVERSLSYDNVTVWG